MGFTGIAVADHKGRHVHHQNGTPAHHGAFADAAELVHTGLSADNGAVGHDGVTGQAHVIGQNRIVAHDAVVRDMNVRHKKVAVADHSDAVILDCACRDRDVFANDVVVTDHQAGIFTLVLFILRFTADARVGENAVAFTDFSVAQNVHVRNQLRARADLHLRTDHTKRTDNHIIGQFGRRVD